VFWPLLSSSKGSGVPEDSKPPTLGVWISSSHLAKVGLRQQSTPPLSSLNSLNSLVVFELKFDLSSFVIICFSQSCQLLQLTPLLSTRPRLVDYSQPSFYHQPPLNPFPFLKCYSWFSISTITFSHLLFCWYISLIYYSTTTFFNYCWTRQKRFWITLGMSHLDFLAPIKLWKIIGNN